MRLNVWLPEIERDYQRLNVTTRDWTWLPEIERDYQRLREHDATCENDITWWRRDVNKFNQTTWRVVFSSRPKIQISLAQRNQVLLLLRERKSSLAVDLLFLRVLLLLTKSVLLREISQDWNQSCSMALLSSISSVRWSDSWDQDLVEIVAELVGSGKFVNQNTLAAN